jgi:predicted RNA-binding protein YlqC (UPF0109 family)
MKDFLQYLIQNIVDKPDSINIEEEVSGGTTTLFISVDPEDMGKIIGKEGRIIRAIRDLVRILSIKNGTRSNVILKEV